MIITANAIQHNVDILKTFAPAFNPAFKFVKAMNGKYRGSDRGIEADKYSSTINIIGDISDINDLASNLRLEKGQITVDTEGAEIFGPAIDYTSPIICNILNKPTSYPIRDLLTATLKLNVKPTTALTYDGAVPTTLPELFYQWPVSRQVGDGGQPFTTLKSGDFGNSVLVDNGSVAIKSELAKVKFLMTTDEMAQLQRFVSVNRLATFLLTTEVCLELFLGSTSTTVMITDFKFAPSGINYWNSTLTLVNNV